MNRMLALFIAILLLAAMPTALATEDLPCDLPLSVPLDEFTAPQPGAPFDIYGDMGIAVGECWYPILRDFSALKAALGEPLDVILTDSIVHPDYYDKEYVYEFGSVYTHPENGVDIWYELFVVGSELATSRGIAIGSTPEEVLAAYGTEYYADSATVYVYSLSGTEQDYATPSITIEAINNGVIYFDIYYPVYDE